MALPAQACALIGRFSDARVAESAQTLLPHLKSRGVRALLPEHDPLAVAPELVTRIPEDQIADKADLVIAIGGDGTLLYAARLVAHRGVPLIGINRGRLGFLTDVLPQDMLESVDAAEVHLPIFSDLYAIRRNPDGDFFNALDPRARDSMTVLGASWSPPTTFTSLELVIDSPEGVFISYGFYGSFIPVNPVLPYQALRQLEATIPIESNRTTVVTVTFDLDQSLLQLTETFLFVPVFYISSVQIL